MEESSRNDIRKLLKTFGIQADELMGAHLQGNPGMGSVKIRLVLEDLTDYGDSPPEKPLHLVVEGEIRR